MHGLKFHLEGNSRIVGPGFSALIRYVFSPLIILPGRKTENKNTDICSHCSVLENKRHADQVIAP
jgi:hypothetical protein